MVYFRSAKGRFAGKKIEKFPLSFFFLILSYSFLFFLSKF